MEFAPETVPGSIEPPGMTDISFGIILVLSLITAGATDRLVHRANDSDSEPPAETDSVAIHVVVGPDDTVTIDGQRLQDQEKFLDQIRHRLAEVQDTSNRRGVVAIQPKVPADWQTFWRLRLSLNAEAIPWHECPPRTLAHTENPS